jgi:hypothetical protein
VGHRGRPTYLYPATILRMAASLARWHRFVPNPVHAKVWLRLEGFDGIDLNLKDAQFNARAIVEPEWRKFQASIPLLHDLGAPPPQGERREQLLEHIDQLFTKPLHDSFQVSEAKAQTVGLISMLGLADQNNLIDWEGITVRDNARGIEDLEPNYLEACVLSFGRYYGFSVGPDVLEVLRHGDAVSFFCEALPALSLPSLAQAEVDWLGAAAIWRILCEDTDAWLTAPKRPPNTTVAIGCVIRRVCYQQLHPVFVASILSMFSKLDSPHLELSPLWHE